MKLLTDFVFVTGLVITVIIIFALFRKKKRELPQNILIVFFIAISLTLLSAYSYLHEIKPLFLLTFNVQDCIELFAGPLLYIYVKSLYHTPKGLIKKHLFHFIPFIFYLIVISIPVLIGLIMNESLFEYIDIITKNYDFLLFMPHSIIFFVYCILSFFLLKKYTQKVKLNYSTLEEKDLSWIKNFIVGLMIVGGVNLTMNFIEIILGDPEWTVDYLTYYVLVIMVIYLGYHGVTQSRVLLPDFLIAADENPIPIENPIKNNTVKLHHLSNATSEEIATMKERLKEALETEKPYLNEDLTLGGLAQLIPTTDKKLSALLNHELEITFYDLINSYRVEEVKSKMNHKDYQHYTLLAIGYDCGFKSKTSFNRVFKKVTGFSPSEYKKKNLEQFDTA